MEISLPIAFPDLSINLSIEAFLHISDLSEQVFENYLNPWLINSHLLEQVLYDNFLYSKFFEAKDILRYLKIHQIGFCSDFQKSTPIFNNVCYYEITLKRFFIIYSIQSSIYNIRVKDFCLLETSLDSRYLNTLLNSIFNTFGCMKSTKNLNKDLKFIFHWQVNINKNSENSFVTEYWYSVLIKLFQNLQKIQH